MGLDSFRWPPDTASSQADRFFLVAMPKSEEGQLESVGAGRQGRERGSLNDFSLPAQVGSKVEGMGYPAADWKRRLEQQQGNAAPQATSGAQQIYQYPGAAFPSPEYTAGPQVRGMRQERAASGPLLARPVRSSRILASPSTPPFLPPS